MIIKFLLIIDSVWSQFHGNDFLNYYALFALIAFVVVFGTQLVLLFR